MKLQVKDAGAWRNVVGFEQRQSKAVMAAAELLIRAVDNERVTLRIEDDGKALAYCEAPHFLWRTA